MKTYDYECPKGHQFETEAEWDSDFLPCTKPRCKETAERIWISRRSGYRHLETPIILDKLPDGSYSFPGTRDAKAPAGAERIEIRSFADYKREMKHVNNHYYLEAERKREALQEKAEIIQRHFRREAANIMGELNDNFGKDLIRAALEHYNTDRPDSSYGRIWNEAMEA